jgi:hypothetical protein
MATLITLTKVGFYDQNGSYYTCNSESIRVATDSISSIETHTSGSTVMLKAPQKLDDGTITGYVASQTPAQIQTLFDATVSTVNPVIAVSADGAITIPSVNTTYFCTKAGVAAMTIANPTATTHDGLRLTFIATTAQANTLSNAGGGGFNDGGTASDIGTFGGAKGDNIVIEAYQGKWYVVSKVNVTLA